MGRNKGSKNITTINDIDASRCLTCGSTERTGYANRHVQDYEGTKQDGTVYNQIVRRATRCLKCGQCRIDRTFELVTKGETENKPVDERYKIEAYGGGYMVADYSGERGEHGAAYVGCDGVWTSHPIVDPFDTEELAKGYIETLAKLEAAHENN